MDDDQAYKTAYAAASAAYGDIANHNLSVMLVGGIPTEKDFQREDEAHAALEKARRALLRVALRRVK